MVGISAVLHHKGRNADTAGAVELRYNNTLCTADVVGNIRGVRRKIFRLSFKDVLELVDFRNGRSFPCGVVRGKSHRTARTGKEQSGRVCS